MRKSWTKEKCLKVVEQYSTFKDFRKENNDAFLAARRHGWIEEIKSMLPLNVTKWSNKSDVFIEAKKYKTKNEFRKKSKGAYEACSKNKWINDPSLNWEAPKFSKDYIDKWTKEKCIEEAKKYEWKTDFIKKSPGAWAACKKMNCIDEATANLKIKLNRHWTKETCWIEAKKYISRGEFSIKSKGAYIFSTRKGWLDEICSHMKSDIVYWNNELCKTEALKYQSRSEFSFKCRSAYNFATTNKILDEICEHMKPQGNLFKRMIYCYEFSDNTVYIGLTYNEDKRKSEHLTDGKGPVAKYILKTGINPEYKKLNDYVDEIAAKNLEQEFINEYRSKGWKILNSTKAGALGGNSTKWTKEECKKVAQFYSRRVDFQHSKLHYTAYSAAAKHKWLDYVCEHMVPVRKYWSREKCIEEVKKHKSKIEFMRISGGAYNYASRNGFINEIWIYLDKG